MSEWVKAKDRLPDEDGEFIAYLKRPVKHGKRIVMYTFFHGQWVSIEGSVWPDMPRPSHWMPKPNPPSNKL